MSKGHCVYSWLCFREWCCWFCGDYSTHLLTCLSSCLAVWASGKDHRSTISHSFSFHPPATTREVGALCSSILTSDAVCCFIPSLYSCFTVCWATVSLLNYCIWNQLPNHGAKNTPNNQVIRMWVDELFLYTVWIANKSLNLFRELDNIPKAGILSIVPSSLLVFFQKEGDTHVK